MIKIFHSPTLLDFIHVCIRMPQDERDQLEAFTGHPYDIDGAALGSFMAPGLKWVFKEAPDGVPLGVAGFVQRRPGVWRDFMMTTPELWDQYPTVTRIVNRAIKSMFMPNEHGHRFAHRIECICLASREAKNSRWYHAIGYNREATLYGYAANGADAVVFSKVRH